MKILFATLCLFVWEISCFASDYKGVVYIDSNKNGIFDIGEKPLSKVMVSDGLNVVSTNNMGEFNLPGYEKTHFIFITIPAGYKTSQYYQRVDSGMIKK
ncbi:MAG: metallophosphoesterase N-terminal domain-containing protein, partial [Bacteroidota bacterium]|nr:metallophosphoesterase N-terminal domain-containing protein [Bacteroidota bacterium]